MDQDKQSTPKKANFFVSLVSGGILKEDFVVKNTQMIIVIFILLVFYIGNRYTCLSKLREIDRLQKELQDVKNEAIHFSGQLTGHNRMSQIEQLVESQGLGLESAQSPPYILHK
ncbi:MAG: hypothetical protein LBE56_02550 [Tannerella sp.]|jgi:hypothetical protein|nr:hypothetical protein [Tannerella sp.]